MAIQIVELDAYEHVLYVDHQNRKAQYVEKFMAHIDWNESALRFLKNEHVVVFTVTVGPSNCRQQLLPTHTYAAHLAVSVSRTPCSRMICDLGNGTLSYPGKSG